MTTKKTYCKGYKYSLFQSLITPTMLVLENDLPYCKGRLEAQIYVNNKSIIVNITDGFTTVYFKTGFNSLKQALNIAHGKMQLINENK